MIIEKYVSFETAVLLREVGFEWPGIKFNESHTVIITGNAKPPFGNTCYNDEKKEICPKYFNMNNAHYPRPTLAMACDWVEEKFGAFIQLDAYTKTTGLEFFGIMVNLCQGPMYKIRYGETSYAHQSKHEVIDKVLCSFLTFITKK